MKAESHIPLLYKQSPCKHPTCPKHHCVLPLLLLPLPSSRVHPFLLQNTSCFRVDILSIRPSWWNTFNCFFFIVSFSHLRECALYLLSVFPSIHSSTCSQVLSLYFFFPSLSIPYLSLHLSIHSYIFVISMKEISLSLSPLWGNPSVFLTFSLSCSSLQ